MSDDYYTQKLASRANTIAANRARAEYRRANATVRIAAAQERIAAALEQLVADGAALSDDDLAAVTAATKDVVA